ncbi:unnamed protein product [Rhodiola kirilowii]
MGEIVDEDDDNELFFCSSDCRRMRDIPGTPKTFTGFLLRIAQLISATGSLYNYINVPSSCASLDSSSNYLISVLFLPIMWSAIFFLYFLTCKNVVHDTNLISVLVITGDSVMAFSGLACASALFGVAMYFNDKVQLRHGAGCPELWMSSVLALMSCSINFTSFLVVLWATAKH